MMALLMILWKMRVTHSQKLSCLKKSKKNFSEFSYVTEIQSHYRDFDFLKSVDIDEKINCIEWLSPQNDSMFLLSTNDSWVGWIGMLEWLDPKIEAPTPRTRMGIGDALLVFNTEKVDEHCAAVAKLPGINMTAPASNTTYPARAGGKPIVVRTCYLFDRDGYFMELNKVLDRKNYNKN